jgi:hypothetical protein
MNALRTIFGIFLIVHGLVHTILAAAPRPDLSEAAAFTFWTRPPQLLSGLGESSIRPMGMVLWIASTVLFVAAGLGVLAIPGLRPMWQELTIASAAISLLLLLLFWHPWLIVGFKWPPASVIN